MSATRDLARFVACTTYADLPRELVERARVYALDNLAAGFLGSVQPWSAIVADTLGGSGAGGRARRAA
jgi:2-methylcitrate dehydratase PrpD